MKLKILVVVCLLFCCRAVAYLSLHHRSYPAAGCRRLFGTTNIDLQYPLPELETIKAVEIQRQRLFEKTTNTRSDGSGNSGTLSLTPSDLQQIRGDMSLSAAQRELSALGYIINADLKVSEDGENIEYSYAVDQRNTIGDMVNQRNRQMQIKTVVNEKVIPFAYTTTKVLFGVFLLSSLAIAATAAIAALSVSSGDGSSSDRDDSSSNSRSNTIRMNRIITQTTLDVYRYDYFYNPNRFNKNDPQSRQDPIGFITRFYSFVFGDGNPNFDMEKKQLQKAISVIRENKGVICAEQLAPYLNPPKIEDIQKKEEIGSAVVDESWMIETMIKLDGEPIVTEDGDIIYDFTKAVESGRFVLDNDDLIGDSASNSSNNTIKNDEEDKLSFIEESVIPFTVANDGLMSVPSGLGVLNIIGVATIRNILRRGVLAVQYPALNAFLGPVYPLLLAYSIFYVAAPMIRSQRLKQENARIIERNENRKKWSKLLKEKGSYVPRKMNAIRRTLQDKLSRR